MSEQTPSMLDRLKRNPAILWGAAICAVLAAIGGAFGGIDKVWSFFHRAPVVAPVPPTLSTDNALTAPHAPPIELGQLTETWGEKTQLIQLEAGAEQEVDGRNLYAVQPTYPTGSCLGPEYIAYTWQIRSPYPAGGDLEIREIVQGGGSMQVGLGSMGKGTMGPCGLQVFQNHGLSKIQLELRYASALNKPLP